MYPALRSLPCCAPINRDHACEHERKSEFCFEVGNETRNPRRRGHNPIKCWRVTRAQVTKKPNQKTGSVNRPADTFGTRHPTRPRFLSTSPPADDHREQYANFCCFDGVTTVPVRPSFFGWGNEKLL